MKLDRDDSVRSVLSKAPRGNRTWLRMMWPDPTATERLGQRVVADVGRIDLGTVAVAVLEHH
jgi:hypothetical protein